MRGPGVQKGVTKNEPTTNLDLTATFLDYAAVRKPEGMDSRSLRPLLTGKKTAIRDHVFSGMEQWRLVMQGQYKYIRGWENQPLLFDLSNDPLENENLATQKPDVVARMAKLEAAQKQRQTGRQ